jgi:NAD(P)H dehydrogenase (quinone)
MSDHDKLLLITGATGTTGDPTVRLLLQRGHRVRALVHRADARSERLAAAGAEIVVGDLHDLGTVSQAMAGVTGAYFCYPVAPGLLEATAIFAQEASDAGVTAVVNMSQLTARPNAKSTAAQHHWLSERLLDRTPMITTHLRPTFFAEWLNWYWATDGTNGVYRLPMGTGRHAPIAGEDQAHVIAAVLANPQPHDRQTYRLFGPVEMDYYEIADTLSASLGMAVTYEPIDIAEFCAGLAAKGFPAYQADNLGHFVQDYQDGLLAGTNDVVQRIGGRTPLTVHDYASARRDAFTSNGPYCVPRPGTPGV